MFRTIRVKLIAGVVTLIVALAAVSTVVATQRAEAAVLEQIHTTHEARAETASLLLDDLLQDAARIAAVTAGSEAFRAGVPFADRNENGTARNGLAADKRAVLDTVVQAVPTYAGVLYVDAQGVAVVSSPDRLVFRAQDGPTGTVSAYAVTAALAREAERPFVQRGAEPGTWWLAAPTATDDGTIHGVLVFHADPEILMAFAREAVAKADDRLFIVDDQGRLLGGPAGSERGSDLGPITGTTALGGTETVELAGVPHLATVFALDSAPWRIMLATDEAVAFASVQSILRATLASGAIALVVAVGAGWALAHRITDPIARVRSAADRIAAGEYGTQARVRARDEFADLAAAFNLMSARLQEENQRLHQYQDELEETIERRTEALREKNEELEAFVYAASHDMRTPLISLDWLVQDLESQESQLDAETRETLQRIRANVDGMDRLVADLLQLSRIGRTEGEPEEVPLAAIVAEVQDEVRPNVRERDIRLQVDVPPDAVVLADRRRMKQVFANMIGNAIKYGKNPGGTVIVRATPIGAAERPWKWRVDVQDDGPGLPEEDRERVFLLFQRAPDPLGRTIEGTGVGLAIVRKIIRAYDGDIQVTNAPGGGALFYFTLPAPRSPRAATPRGPIRANGDTEGPQSGPDAAHETARTGAEPPPPRTGTRPAAQARTPRTEDSS